MAYVFIKQEYKNNETVIDAELLENLQDGIAYAHERINDIEGGSGAKEITHIPNIDGYVDCTTGEISDSGKFDAALAGTLFRTDYISLDGFFKISGECRMLGIGYSIAFFDKNKNLLPDISIVGESTVSLNQLDVYVPIKASYCIFSCFQQYGNVDSYFTLKPINGFDDRIERLEDNIANFENGTNIEIDTALEQEGKAADAKAVGDKLKALAEYEPITASLMINGEEGDQILEVGSMLYSPSISWSISKAAQAITLAGMGESGKDSVPVETHKENGDPILEGEFTGETFLPQEAFSHQWKIYAREEYGKSEAVATISVHFYYRAFYGVASDYYSNIKNHISNLPNQPLQSSFVTSFSVDNANDLEYIWYVVPYRWGKRKFSINGAPGGFSLVKTKEGLEFHNFVTVNNHAEYYYVYRTDFPGLGENINVEVW